MSAMIKRLLYRMGYRGAFLLFLGLGDIAYGSFYLLTNPLRYPPLGGSHAWGLVFIAVGLFLLTGVFVRSDRWHYAVAAAIKMLWSLRFIALSERITFDWLVGMFWLSLAAIVIVVSSWPEPMWIRVARKAQGIFK